MPALVKKGPNRYLLPQNGAMKVDALIFLSEKLRAGLDEEDDALKQLSSAASLPGVFNPVIGMPDIHSGFGLPIGGVLATKLPEGVVSAGAVGMDINCGVRLLKTNIPAADLDKRLLRLLITSMGERVPAGVGQKTRYKRFCQEYMEDILCKGAAWLVLKGYGRKEDLERIEEYGSYEGADPDCVSRAALSRSMQLSTLGGGNHFLELGKIAEVFDLKLAKAFGLSPGMLTVLIHTGSRGLGHQICVDYTEIMAKAAKKYGISLPSKGLACVPADSTEGSNYLKAMACAVNYAFANRQMITYDVRKSFADVFKLEEGELDLGLVYDLAHNIVKKEKHYDQDLLVHRKGATRALPPGHSQNPSIFSETGHPVIIPGTMGTSSYVVVGTEKVRETFCSVNHGAGRVLSRSEARKTMTFNKFNAAMDDIILNTRKIEQLFDEAPQAYKDIDEVVNTLAEIKLISVVARLQPLAVIKGEVN